MIDYYAQACNLAESLRQDSADLVVWAEKTDEAVDAGFTSVWGVDPDGTIHLITATP